MIRREVAKVGYINAQHKCRQTTEVNTMYSGKISWTSIDPGQEGLLMSTSWLSVLQILQKNEGETHRDLHSPLFRDLEHYMPDTSWRGKDGNRSFFRDYGKSWKEVGALDRDLINATGEIRLTRLGHDIANEKISVRDFFRSVIDDYKLPTIRLSSTNEKLSFNPFRQLSYTLIQEHTETFSTLQDSVGHMMLHDYTELSDCTFIDTTTSARRFKSFVRLLAIAEAVAINGSKVEVIDLDYLAELTAGRALAFTDLTDPLIHDHSPSVTNMTKDERPRRAAERIVREGQKSFRDSLLKAYDSRCAITGAHEESILEAAHIMDYKGRQTNTVKNGILLAVDIHRLFDANLLGINPESRKVELSKNLVDRRYLPLSGTVIQTPAQTGSEPNYDYLNEKYADFKSKQSRR